MLTKYGPIEILRDIIVNQMALDGERVMFYNQKWDIPPDDGLFVEIEFRYAKPYSNRNQLQDIQGVTTEVADVNMQEHYTVRLFSKNLDALRRKEEVLMALASIYSQNQQEKNSFRIAPIMNIQDVSEVEASARLYRFDIDVVVLAWYTKKQAQTYYNTLNVEVIVDEGGKTVEQDFTQNT